MSETVVTPPSPPAPSPNPAPSPEPKLFAGKYKDPEALEAGTREIRKTLGLETPDGALYGKDGAIAGDVLALERHYKDLETLYGKFKTPEPKPDAGKPGELAIKPETKAPPPDDADVDAIVAKAGLKATELGETWLKDGKLTEDQYKALAGQGYSRKMVDSYMGGQVAIAQQSQARIAAAEAEGIKVAGGEEQHKNLRAWASHNIPAAELKRLGDQVEADPAFYPTYIEIIASRHRQEVAGGKAQPLITGSGSGGGAGAATSSAELSQLMRAAENGDTAALARIRATPIETINKWSR